MAQLSKGSHKVHLPQAKRELALARARGEADALARLLAVYPQYIADLIEFDAALVATSFVDETVVAESGPLAERALVRALTAVFPEAVAPVAAASASLKIARLARHISLKELAQRLDLSVDVISLLESGGITASTVPERLTRMLGEALDLATDAVAALLHSQPVATPALRRSRSGERKDAAPLTALTFADAIRQSPGMSQAQKDTWLTDR